MTQKQALMQKLNEKQAVDQALSHDTLYQLLQKYLLLVQMDKDILKDMNFSIVHQNKKINKESNY